MIFALVGNQNCGKTTLFNALTGSNQHVGNFPGVTVDQKPGEIRGEKGCSVVDLPGIYSLRPYTQEEIVSRDYILNQKPDGIINIVDATNIERNLYLTLQLLELRVPMVLALNMMDEVRANGGSIDVRKMSKALGIPVVPISAAKDEGVSELIDQAVQTVRAAPLPSRIGSTTPIALTEYCIMCASRYSIPVLTSVMTNSATTTVTMVCHTGSSLPDRRRNSAARPPAVSAIATGAAIHSGAVGERPYSTCSINEPHSATATASGTPGANTHSRIGREDRENCVKGRLMETNEASATYTAIRTASVVRRTVV